MDTTANQRQTLYQVNDLVLIKYKKAYRLYQLERIDHNVEWTQNRRESITGVFSPARTMRVEHLYIFKSVLTKDGKKSTNSKRRCLPYYWLDGVTDSTRDPYSIKLEDYVRREEQRLELLKSEFVNFHTKLDARAKKGEAQSRRSGNGPQRVVLSTT